MLKPQRDALTQALRVHVAKIAADLRVKMQDPATARARAVRLHADERVGEDFDVWTDLLSRRAAVLWVLKSVYVRVLEDRGLLRPGRLLDPEAQQLFERLAPHLGETAFLRWVYRDLASPRGGLPELFGVAAAEIAAPADELSRGLIQFWRARDPDTGAAWSFAEEKFEGELMGDLYQELDPVVKDRYALCQTPDFVRAFILDRTLTPAIETFGADQVRLLDPACGSGHFLIDGLKRLVEATAGQHPEWARVKVVEDVLGRVVGLDINDYACALARTRLVMTAAELSGVTTLAEAGRFHPHVYWADGLEQVERDDERPAQPRLFGAMEKPRAMFTRSEVRTTLRTVFSAKFHAVVANPPYIMETDSARKEYHREKKSRVQRYVTAFREYTLAALFVERAFQLLVPDGFQGTIVENAFMKWPRGKPLVESVLARRDLWLVVDTSQAFIPHHGTPTVMLFARNAAPASDSIIAILGKRGQAGVPDDPSKGQVWSSILAAVELGAQTFDNEFVSREIVPRNRFSKHPWTIRGGGASDIRAQLDASGEQLGTIASTGLCVISGADGVFLHDSSTFVRHRVRHSRALVRGKAIRDWCADPGDGVVLWPHDSSGNALSSDEISDVLSFLWPYRTTLRTRRVFGKVPEALGLPWWVVKVYREKLRGDLALVIAGIATHNKAAFDRSGVAFNNRSAPVIKLPPGATEDDHLALLGVLNSSVAGFWMKSVFQCKGSQGVNEGTKSAEWEQFFEFDSTKLKLFPVAAHHDQTAPYAARLDKLARSRADRSARAAIDDTSWSTAADLRRALDVRRAQDYADLIVMVALQEELDWLCYYLYGLDDFVDVVPPDAVDPLPPTWLPWTLNLACRDAEIRSALARGENPGEIPTAWFERHRWDALTELPPEASTTLQCRIEARRVRSRKNPALTLIESANFKRRWFCPDYEAEEKAAINGWLADRVESAAMDRMHPFVVEQLAALLQDDPRVLTVCEVLTGRQDYSLPQIVGVALARDAVPNHRFHRYKPSGLVKRAAWERIWEAQRREDSGEVVPPDAPPTYNTGDYLRTEYWQLRGKFDVPQERFVAFTEVPMRSIVETTLYGWAGWTPFQRLKAVLALDEQLEDDGVPLADRVGLLDSAWRLLPDVAREDPEAAARLKAELQAVVGPDGPSPDLVEEWRLRFPPPTTRAQKRPRVAQRKRSFDENDGDDEESEAS